MTDEHFIVWMRTSGLPVFRKLWGRIDGNLKPGKYIVKVYNNYQVHDFNGAKTIVLSTLNALGGKNDFVAFGYIVVGSVCTFGSLLFFICSLRDKDERRTG